MNNIERHEPFSFHYFRPTSLIERISMISAKRVLYVANDPKFFFIQRLPIVLGLQAAGYEVHVAFPGDVADPRFVHCGFTVHSLRLRRAGLNPFQELRTLLELYRLYRRLRPDLVHHVAMKPVLYGGVAARLASVPAVVQALTGLGVIFISQGWKAAFVRSLINRLLRFVCNRPEVRMIFQNPDDLGLFICNGIVSQERAVLIRGSGVDVEEFRQSLEPSGDVVVLLPARLLWDKGVGEFVAAARELRSLGITGRFVLVGDLDPNPAAISKGQLNSWVAEGVVEWWGWRDDMAATLAKAHVVCLPSYREGLPKSLIEAAAVGKPLITTDVPGCREVVRNGHNGFLIPVREVESLMSAMKTLIESPSLRQKMGRHSREMAEREFRVEMVVARTVALYDNLLHTERGIAV